MKFKKLLSFVTALAAAFSAAAAPFADSAVMTACAADYIAAEADKAGTYYKYNGFYYGLLDNGTVEIWGYYGTNPKVVIPKKINGKTVTSIGSWAFYDGNNKVRITSVKMPETITHIGQAAFMDCSKIVSIVLPENLKELESLAFCGCLGLKCISMSTKLKTIGSQCFNYCIFLRDLYYTGTIYEWKQINISSMCNGHILEAKRHYVAPLHTAPVTGLKVTSRTDTTAVIKWTRDTNATGYKIQKYDSSTKKWKTIKTIDDEATTQYKVKKLSPATKYKFRVRTVRANEWSSNGKTLTVTTKLPKVTGIKCTAKTYNSLTLKWNKVEGAVGYKLLKLKSDGTWKEFAKVKSNSCKITGLKALTRYSYKIIAYDKNGVSSVASDVFKAKTCDKP